MIFRNFCKLFIFVWFYHFTPFMWLFCGISEVWNNWHNSQCISVWFVWVCGFWWLKRFYSWLWSTFVVLCVVWQNRLRQQIRNIDFRLITWLVLFYGFYISFGPQFWKVVKLNLSGQFCENNIFFKKNLILPLCLKHRIW